MKSFRTIFFAVIACAFLNFKPSDRPDTHPLLGFHNERAAEERALEKRFDSYLSRDDLRAWMKRLSAHPHNVGSAYDRENAEFIDSLFNSWGYKTEIEQFFVLFPTPKTRILEMIAPKKFSPRLSEPVLTEDSTSNETSEQLPTYNAYSIDGDVTGDLVYVNYGTPNDYEELDRLGIDVKKKIVIARYGGAWRGIKPKVAAERGAIGCIIYSDPRDDGYFEGDVYPQGAYRSENGAQRGSVADMPLYPGDPLTPFIGATPQSGAKRLSVKDAPTLTKIPVMPISYADALPFLSSLTGPVAPEEWRGALPITYHLGPGSTKVHLKLEFNWNIVPIYDVIATMTGEERPDEWIIRGNHHDAWVNGASDPVSGQVAMLEEAHAMAELSKTGWKPKRTIVYCAWDGEEPGLLGSTEWVETHADVLRQKAVVYINSDSNGRGFLFAGGSHSLEKFINEVARDVTDPERKISVWERARDLRIVQGSPEERMGINERSDLRIYPMGSGSDYTPFLQHLGITSLNIGYGGEDGGGSYHSIYDSYDHYMRFDDSTFDYGIALAQTAGRAIIRLSDADVLPFEFTDFAETIQKFVKEVTKLTDDMREETEQTNRLIREGVLKAASDPKEPFVPPNPKDPVPYLNFAPLQNALSTLQNATKELALALNVMDSSGRHLPLEAEQSIDAIFMKAEQSLTRKEGLPRRPWYVHEIYAPGFYTGYDVKTLPGVREAIEQRNWKEANEQIEVVASVLDNYARDIKNATALVAKAAK